jgi:hypothetical protein
MVFKYMLLILLLLTVIELAQCQNNTTGISVGYNTSMVHEFEAPILDHKRMPGIHIGGLYKHTFPTFAIQSELLISSKGYQSNSIGDTYINNLFLYLELPFYIRKNILDKKNFQLYLICGVSVMYKVLAINLVSEIDGVRNFDSGINLGAGIQHGKISLDVRFTQSYINLDLIKPSKFNQTLSVGMNFYFKDKSP